MIKKLFVMLVTLLVALGLSGLVGCGGTDTKEGRVTKEDAEAGKADTDAISRMCRELGFPEDCDICEAAGWYDDGECDTFCIMADGDCDYQFPQGCEDDSYCFTSIGAFCQILEPIDPSYPRMGQCMLKDGFSCTNDSHCDPGMTCVPDCAMGQCGGMCMPNGCHPEKSTFMDCGEENTCRLICTTDPETGVESCRGECRAPGDGICNVDSDCEVGQYCIQSCGAGSCWGSCVEGTCSDDTDCFSSIGAICLIHTPDDDPPREPWGECVFRDGMICSDDSHCGLAMQCVPDCGTTECIGMCVPNGCISDEECDQGAECFFVCSNMDATCRGECRMPGDGICNVDYDCDLGLTCTESCGAGSCWGECVDMGPPY